MDNPGYSSNVLQQHKENKSINDSTGSAHGNQGVSSNLVYGLVNAKQDTAYDIINQSRPHPPVASHRSHDPTSHYNIPDHADQEHDYQELESIAMDQRGDTPDDRSLEYVNQGRDSGGKGWRRKAADYEIPISKK